MWCASFWSLWLCCCYALRWWSSIAVYIPNMLRSGNPLFPLNQFPLLRDSSNWTFSGDAVPIDGQEVSTLAQYAPSTLSLFVFFLSFSSIPSVQIISLPQTNHFALAMPILAKSWVLLRSLFTESATSTYHPIPNSEPLRSSFGQSFPPMVRPWCVSENQLPNFGGIDNLLVTLADGSQVSLHQGQSPS